MLRDQIITSLYNSKEVNEAIDKMEPAELREDLKAEMFLALMELPDERIITMHEQGFIKFYLVRMMLNMIKSDRSSFYNKYRRQIRHTPEGEQPEADYDLSDVTDQVKELHWYEQDLVFSYILNGCNATALSRQVGIPRRSIDYTLKLVRKKIDTAVRKTKKMQIEVNKKIVIYTTKDISPDEIVDLIENYDRMVDRKIRECSTEDTYIHQSLPAKLVSCRK
jgi:DNA-directed RNA polymerase specialized sigma24 family protein